MKLLTNKKHVKMQKTTTYICKEKFEDKHAKEKKM